MTHPFIVNLGMILKQVEQEQRYEKPLTSGSSFADRQGLKKAVRYARFCAAANLGDKSAFAKSIGHIQADDIRQVHISSGGKMDPGFFVASDPETGEIVLCIQ